MSRTQSRAAQRAQTLGEALALSRLHLHRALAIVTAIFVIGLSFIRLGIKKGLATREGDEAKVMRGPNGR